MDRSAATTTATAGVSRAPRHDRGRRRLALALSGLALTAVALGGCQTRSAKKRDDDLRLADDAPPGKPLTTPELSGEAGSGTAGAKAGKPEKGGKAAKGARSAQALAANAARAAACRKAIGRWTDPYRRLHGRLPPGVYVAQNTPLDQLVAADPAACQDSGTRTALLRTVAAAVTAYEARIGLILPLTGARAKESSLIMAGLKAAFQDAGLNFEQQVLVRDSAGVAATAEQRLAELVFRDRVALVIGGMEREEAAALSAWSAELALPVLLLNRDRDLTGASPYAFRYYPDERRLAALLWDAAAKAGHKRIAILRPVGGKSDRITEYFRQAATAGGAAIVHDLVYTPNNFDSMQAVAGAIFRTDPSERADEWRQAYWKARARAQREKVPFDPRMVVLKPIVDFDAVFLPDDFRTVRHFVKLFKFNQVEHLPLIGNHEWRSPALIEPWDDFLDGAIFGDFVGTYTRLPASIATPTIGSPFFIRPEAVLPTDFAMIGYRAGQTATLVLKQPTRPARTVLPRTLAALKGDGSGLLGAGSVFDADRNGIWPTYLFRITKEGLTLQPEPPDLLTPAGAKPAPAISGQLGVPVGNVAPAKLSVAAPKQ